MPRIFNLLKVVIQLPDQLKANDNSCTVTYELGKKSRNKILDCEEDINSNYGMRMHLLFSILIRVTALILPSVIFIINKLRKRLANVETIENHKP